MYQKDADRMANSVDVDQTAPWGAIRSGSILFAQTCLSENFTIILDDFWIHPDLTTTRDSQKVRGHSQLR